MHTMISYDSPSLSDLKHRVHASDARCPVCGSYDISGSSFDTDSNVVFQKVECETCGATWNDQFVYDGAHEVEFSDSYYGFAPSAYERIQLTNGMEFSCIMPNEDNPRQTNLFEQLSSVVNDLIDGPGSHTTIPALTNTVKLRMDDVDAKPIQTNSPWGWVSVTLSRVDEEVMLVITNDVCSIPLLTMTLVDATTSFVNPWYALHDRMKNSAVPYLQNILMDVNAELKNIAASRA